MPVLLFSSVIFKSEFDGAFQGCEMTDNGHDVFFIDNLAIHRIAAIIH